jgi:transcription elongation factor Elf1
MITEKMFKDAKHIIKLYEAEQIMLNESKYKYLLPCPFCGDTTISVVREGTNLQSCIIMCEECGCKVESNEIGFGLAWNNRYY